MLRQLNTQVSVLTAAHANLQQQLQDLEQRLAGILAAPPAYSSSKLTTDHPRTAEAPLNTADLQALVADMIAAERAANQVQIRNAVNSNLQRWYAQNRVAEPADEDNFTSRSIRLRDALGLDIAQLAEYEALTAGFQQQAEALYANIDATDMDTFAEQMTGVDQAMVQLDAEFDAAFSAVLTTEQATAYAQLPADSRGLAPDAGAAALEFELSDLLRLAEREN
jgi:hypothetical protein